MTQNKFSPVGKHVLHTALALAMLQFCLPAVIKAQEVKPAPASLLPFPDNDTQPSAMTISVVGKCE